MRFPNELHVQLIKNNNEKSSLENVVLAIKLNAPQKNDYHLGPFFSDSNGEYKLSENVLKISADAVIQSGLMDYVHYELCSDVVAIQILSPDEVVKMIKGRSLWGILEKESEIYISKENLLNRLKENVNHLVAPTSISIDLRKYVGTIELKISDTA